MNEETLTAPAPDAPGKRKVNVSHIIKPIAFFIALLLVLMAASYMLAPKNNTKGSGITNPNANGFFSEEKNSIDVAIIGNSDAYSGFSPMEIWNNFGYTAYVSAEGRQVVAGSLIMLKKLLTCQTPKVVILETDGFYTKTEFAEDITNIFNTLWGDKFSVFQYHDRWKKVKLDEMFAKPDYTAHCSSKGQMLSNDVNGYTGPEYMIETDKAAKIPRATRIALDEFVKTCDENDIKLVFVEVPSQTSWDYGYHNGVQEYADEKGIDFIDLNIDRQSFGFDWTTDSRDGGNHLNTRGARKVSMLIGQYLADNFNLTDHRDDVDFAEWNEDFRIYQAKNMI